MNAPLSPRTASADTARRPDIARPPARCTPAAAINRCSAPVSLPPTDAAARQADPRSQAKADSGFTLIEALVAMAILATSAVALLGATQVHIGRIGELERRTAARWAAETHLAALRLGLPAPRAVTTFGYAWTIEADRTPTSDPDLAQVTVTAAPADDPRASLVRLTGFLDTARGTP